MALDETRERRQNCFQMWTIWTSGEIHSSRLEAYWTLSRQPGKLDLSQVKREIQQAVHDVCIFLKGFRVLLDHQMIDRDLAVDLFRNTIFLWIDVLDRCVYPAELHLPPNWYQENVNPAALRRSLGG